jgi:glycosyltransferase involved in cell wall biosynthesis
MEGIKLLSLIVPAYKQEKTIRRDILSLQKALSKLQIKYEIIIVIDGMVDKTYERVKKIKSKKLRIYLYRENKGKGYAVQYGMLHAKGDVIGFIDAGMDINPTGILMLLNHLIWYDADVIIGSKLHSVSRVSYPPVRKVFSWGYRTFTRILFGFKVRDTQVGLKILRRKVVLDVIPRLTVHNFAFDIEMLAVAYYLGYKKIYEAPVKLKLNPELSSVTNSNFWKPIL